VFLVYFINIGKFTKEDSMLVNRRASREIELENSTGWVSKHKVHKSAKDYTRKLKHKNEFF
jgi:hypothetical protein